MKVRHKVRPMLILFAQSIANLRESLTRFQDSATPNHTSPEHHQSSECCNPIEDGRETGAAQLNGAHQSGSTADRTRTNAGSHSRDQCANSDTSDLAPSTMNPSDHIDPSQPGSDSQVRSALAVSRLSPESYSTFKDHLDHVPEMNLPWQSLRSVCQCTCGVAFSFATRKVSTTVSNSNNCSFSNNSCLWV